MGKSRLGARQWLPLAITIFGMAFYMAIQMLLALRSGDVPFDPHLIQPVSIATHLAQVQEFRAAAAIAIVSTFAAWLAALFLMLRSLNPEERLFHLAVLIGLWLLSIAIGIASPPGATAILQNLLCAHRCCMTGQAFFCQADFVTHQIFGLFNLRQGINLWLGMGACSVAYAAFAIAYDGIGRGTLAERERTAAIVIAFGGVMLVSSILLDHSYARWALADALTLKPAAAFINAMTFFAGSVSSALLAMIWLFTLGLLALDESHVDEGGPVSHLLSPQSALFGLLGVAAPLISAYAAKLLS